MATHGLARPVEQGAEAPRVARRMRPRAMRPTDVAHESPAMALQSKLARAWVEESEVEARWSARRSLAFMALFNGVFWIGLGVAVTRMLSSI